MKNRKNSSNRLGLPAKLKTKPYMAAMRAIALVVVLGGTVYASNGAKPGDVLYSIDTTSEKVQSLLAFSPSSKADLALSLATERVEEAQDVLEVSGFNSADLNGALVGLIAQKQALADLVAKEAELKQLVKQYEDAFEEREAVLDAIFSQAESRLEAQEKELEAQLKQAKAANNNDEVTRITAALAALEARFEALEAEEEAAEEALETEEERLEAEMEDHERAEEAEEEAREEAEEAEKEQLEHEAEQAAEEAREAESEQ